MAREKREVWIKRVERWRETGLTAREFAAEVGIDPMALSRWSWRLRAEQRRVTFHGVRVAGRDCASLWYLESMDSAYFFLLKPIFYLLVFTFGALWLKSHGPHWRLPAWAIVTLATIARYAAGWGVFFLLHTLSHTLRRTFVRRFDTLESAAMLQIIIAFGFALWWLTARVAFRRAPRTKLLLFALLGELLSAAIDYWAWRDLQHINIC